MQIRVIVAGKPALAYARIGIDEYLKRLSRTTVCELVSVKAGSSDEVSSRLLDASRGCYRIGLDERGAPLTTREFATKMSALETRGDLKTAAFLLGAADGHNDRLRGECDQLLSLSQFTLQHELALLVLMEQLYRLATLKLGGPYHRD
jgi:23S rRNA (pseudouridine1915-N3)-methyltransferase